MGRRQRRGACGGCGGVPVVCLCLGPLVWWPGSVGTRGPRPCREQVPASDKGREGESWVPQPGWCLLLHPLGTSAPLGEHHQRPSDLAQTLDCTSSFSILQDVLTAALDPSHIHDKSMMSPLRETVSSSKSPCPPVPPPQQGSGHPRAPHGAMWDNLRGAGGVGLALTWPPTPRAPSGGTGGLVAVAVP